MSKQRTEKNLNKRQRIGWLIIILLLLSTMLIALYRYRIRQAPDIPIHLTIPSIPADTTNPAHTPTPTNTPTDTTGYTYPKSAPKKSKDPKAVTKKQKSSKPKPSKLKSKSAKPGAPPRDITTEDL